MEITISLMALKDALNSEVTYVQENWKITFKANSCGLVPLKRMIKSTIMPIM